MNLTRSFDRYRAPTAPAATAYRFRGAEPLETRAAVSTLLGLTAADMLVSFDSANPSAITSTLAITGLKGTGDEFVAAIATRPKTGQLYALSVQNAGSTDILRLYTVSTSTGAATLVSNQFYNATSAPPGEAASYGLAINPATDVIRIVSSTDVNIRVDPTSGGLTSQDPTLTPAGQQIDDAAFDRDISGQGGATSTTLYTIAPSPVSGELETIGGVNASPSPNTGATQSVGSLGIGIAPGSAVGFTILPSSKAGGTGLATLTDSTSNLTGLYSVNLATGAATPLGTVGKGTTPLIGLTAAPTVTPTPPTPPVVAVQNRIAVGSGPGVESDVRVFSTTGQLLQSFDPFPGFKGGVRVALADINRDGIPDVIVAAGPGATGGHVEVFDGATGQLLRSFFAFPGFGGGVSLAAGDVNGDGYPDIIASADYSTGDAIKVFSGKDNSVIGSFLAFGQYNGLVSVTAGDFHKLGYDQIAIGVAQDGQIKLYTGTGSTPTGSGLPDYFVVNKGVNRNLSLAAGDVNADGYADLIVGEQALSGNIRIFNGADGSQIQDFDSQPAGFANGTSVATVDVNGRPDILSAPGLGIETTVQVFDGSSNAYLEGFNPYGNYAGGASIAGTSS